MEAVAIPVEDINEKVASEVTKVEVVADEGNATVQEASIVVEQEDTKLKVETEDPAEEVKTTIEEIKPDEITTTTAVIVPESEPPFNDAAQETVQETSLSPFPISNENSASETTNVEGVDNEAFESVEQLPDQHKKSFEEIELKEV